MSSISYLNIITNLTCLYLHEYTGRTSQSPSDRQIRTLKGNLRKEKFKFQKFQISIHSNFREEISPILVYIAVVLNQIAEICPYR